MRKKRRKPNPWVTWEAGPGETAGKPPRHVIRGETLPPDAPVPPPAPAPESHPPIGSDPVARIIADFGETPAAPESSRPEWRAGAQPVPPPASPPEPPPAAPPAPAASAPTPPPSWGRAVPATTVTRPDLPQIRPGDRRSRWSRRRADRRPGRRVNLPKPPRPRVPELARRIPTRLPALRPSRLPEPVRRLPAPLWWSLPAAARWSRRHAPHATRAALWLALGAVGVLAGVAAVYGLTRVAALRWDIALPAYAVVAGIAARLIQETPRALTRWTNRKGTPR